MLKDIKKTFFSTLVYYCNDKVVEFEPLWTSSEFARIKPKISEIPEGYNNRYYDIIYARDNNCFTKLNQDFRILNNHMASTSCASFVPWTKITPVL